VGAHVSTAARHSPGAAKRCTLDPRPKITKEEDMYARVVRWEGADAESLEQTASEIRSRAESQGGPPEGVPSKGLLILNDGENGRALGISFFETEDDYREGDETLNSMSPPAEGFGRRVSVEKYEVAVKLEA
jgi:hypothetical protein